MTLKQRALLIRTWLRRYERTIVPVALISGFLVDTRIFTRVDLLWNDLLLLAYIIAAAVGITMLNMVEERVLRGTIITAIAAAMPLVVQFSFGSLFKGLIIFYGQSASSASGWIFVVALAALLIFSEVFVHNYRRFGYQMSLLFLFVLLYDAFFIPVVIGALGPFIFLLSVLVSLMAMAAFAYLLSHIIPKKIQVSKGFLIRAFLGLSALFVILYSLNVIPPLPLALKDDDVLHSFSHTGDTYEGGSESAPWYAWLPTYVPTLHLVKGESAYVYTALFVPSTISLVLKHEWQYHDPASKRWITTDIVSFPVVGGRDGGYRGYSSKGGLTPGSWRVNVVTDYGAVISRIPFDVEITDTEPALTPVVY